MSCGFFNMPEYMDQQYPRAAIRHQISTFHQLPNEPFWQAWQRFDGYQREYPYHDYIDDELLAFFYNGVTRYYQYELDAAGFWDFCAEEDFQGAYRIVDNIAFRSQEYTPPPQYQYPTPPPSTSVTTLEDLQAMFLEAEKTMKKLQEEFVAVRGYSESKHTPGRMVGNQMDEVVKVTESQPETLPMCIAAEEETERMDSELTVLGAEFAEEINLQPLAEHADTLEEEVRAAESKEEMLEFLEKPPTVATVQTTLVVQEAVTTLDEDTLQSKEVHELEDDLRSELCVETGNVSLAETCHDSFSAETEDFSLADTEDIYATVNPTRCSFCAEDIIESAAMPRTGPDKPEYYTITSRFLIKDGGTTAGIPRTGPDIPSFHEFNHSQFLGFTGEGGGRTYCDVVGSVTRPPETLLSVPVIC